MAGMLAGGTSSCTIGPDQMKAISNQAGVYTALGWITLDNPTPEAKAVVVKIAGMIKEKAATIQSGESFMEALYGDMCTFINSDAVPTKYKGLAKAGTLALLNGMDVLFAINPEWLESKDIAVMAIDSFCDGAISSLVMPVDDPIMKRTIAAKQLRLELKLDH